MLSPRNAESTQARLFDCEKECSILKSMPSICATKQNNLPSDTTTPAGPLGASFKGFQNDPAELKISPASV